jgi:hypothetical protein
MQDFFDVKTVTLSHDKAIPYIKNDRVRDCRASKGAAIPVNSLLTTVRKIAHQIIKVIMISITQNATYSEPRFVLSVFLVATP